MAARAFIYSVVRCPARVTDEQGRELDCNRRLFDVPGDPIIQARVVEPDKASGRGRVVRCEKCGRDIEVIEHR